MQEIADDTLTVKTVALTAETVDELMVKYFSVAPYNTSWDARGKVVRVPCDVPTVDGFCAEYDVTPTELRGMVSARTAELCEAKMRNIIKVNGLHRAYDGGFSGLFMKNEANWADKSEVKTTDISHEEALREMIAAETSRQLGNSAKLIEGTHV